MPISPAFGARVILDLDLTIDIPFVSILAPPEGRAQLGTAVQLRRCLWSFNPRPTRRQGATLPGPSTRYQTVRFNPRPTRRQGATRKVAAHAEVASWFQSSPHPKAGRNVSWSMRFRPNRDSF